MYALTTQCPLRGKIDEVNLKGNADHMPFGSTKCHYYIISRAFYLEENNMRHCLACMFHVEHKVILKCCAHNRWKITAWMYSGLMDQGLNNFCVWPFENAIIHLTVGQERSIFYTPVKISLNNFPNPTGIRKDASVPMPTNKNAFFSTPIKLCVPSNLLLQLRVSNSSVETKFCTFIRKHYTLQNLSRNRCLIFYSL